MRANWEVESSGLVLEHAQDPTILHGQREVLQFALEQCTEALVREPEQVAKIGVRLGEGVALVLSVFLT